MVEPRLEFALPRGRCGHVRCGLPATEDDEVFLGRDGGSVKRRVGDVCFEDFEIASGDDLVG